MKKFISKSGDDYAVINLLINYITQQYFKGKSTQPIRWWACSIDFMSTSHRHNIHVFTGMAPSQATRHFSQNFVTCLKLFLTCSNTTKSSMNTFMKVGLNGLSISID